MLSTELLVKNLPGYFTDVDKVDFLKLFGGSEVTNFSFGKMRNCCYVSFPDVITAKQALETLHQFEVLGKKLVVEFAKPVHEKAANYLQAKNILENKIVETKEEKKLDNEKETHFTEEITTDICPKLNVNHAFPAHLVYKYPDPSISTLTNIAHAMITVPKFYTQVLHLMNKMNLPAPFGEQTLTPPLHGDSIVKRDMSTDTFDLQDFRSSEESELESDSDNRKPGIYQSNQVIEPVRKRKRLKALNKINQEKFKFVPLKKAESVESAFEVSSIPKADNTLASRIKQVVERKIEPPVHFKVFDERGDFGKLEPLRREIGLEADLVEDDKEEEDSEDDEGNLEYISSNELQENRISKVEILAMTQFKNYNIGSRSNRLYIKNLSKQVTEDELKFIFTRFICKYSSDKNSTLDIRLMQEGRMKGQAFITFPSENIAEKAVNETHGYVLHEKPMVIQFGRAGK